MPAAAMARPAPIMPLPGSVDETNRIAQASESSQRVARVATPRLGRQPQRRSQDVLPEG